MNQSLPKIFIGSSSEGLDVAQTIQIALDPICESTIWTQGVFGLGDGYLESLLNALEDFDFAILVLTPDDLITSRDQTSHAPRDNILFELGLFMGRIGRNRTFIVHDREKRLKIPSDLAGINTANYRLHEDGNLQASLGPATTKISNQIKRLGTFSNLQNSQMIEQYSCQADWQISEKRARKIGVGTKAKDASNLFFVLLCVADCHKSRIAIADLKAEKFAHVTIEAAYDLMGAWDLLIKYRVDSDSIASEFYQQVVRTLIAKRMMEDDEIDPFGKKTQINVLGQSKTIRSLMEPIPDEIISYVLLPSSSDYDKFRASRSFIIVEARGSKGSAQRMVFLRELDNSINQGLGKNIIESVCEGENELIIETLSTCSQSNLIKHLNREIEPILAIHNLQKYTLSCYYNDETGLLINAQRTQEDLS
ncbi:MAG: nucleotide-binding protein [Leptolyngbyaceae cyanobacterium]